MKVLKAYIQLALIFAVLLLAFTGTATAQSFTATVELLKSEATPGEQLTAQVFIKGDYVPFQTVVNGQVVKSIRIDLFPLTNPQGIEIVDHTAQSSLDRNDPDPQNPNRFTVRLATSSLLTEGEKTLQFAVTDASNRQQFPEAKLQVIRPGFPPELWQGVHASATESVVSYNTGAAGSSTRQTVARYRTTQGGSTIISRFNGALSSWSRMSSSSFLQAERTVGGVRYRIIITISSINLSTRHVVVAYQRL